MNIGSVCPLQEVFLKNTRTFWDEIIYSLPEVSIHKDQGGSCFHQHNGPWCYLLSVLSGAQRILDSCVMSNEETMVAWWLAGMIKLECGVVGSQSQRLEYSRTLMALFHHLSEARFVCPSFYKVKPPDRKEHTGDSVCGGGGIHSSVIRGAAERWQSPNFQAKTLDLILQDQSKTAETKHFVEWGI